MTRPDPREVAVRIRDAALLSGEFTLRSGVVSDTYFDKYLFESDPQLLHDIAVLMAERLPAGTEILAGLEMGGLPVVSVLSQVTGLPAAFLRKQRKTYGTCKYAEGSDLRGRVVVLIEDVVSSGGALLDTLEKLRGDGVEPVGAVCVIDRQTGGREALRARGLELTPLFTFSDVVPQV